MNKTTELIESKLGMMGRMLASSKTSYMNKFPEHEVFFNACIFDSDYNQVWCGDVDFNSGDLEILQELANDLGTLFVTKEQPFRWRGFEWGARIVKENGIKKFSPKV